MKKLKIIATLIIVALALSVFFAACTASDYQLMRSGYEQIADSKKIEKVIEVRSGDRILSSIKETIENTEEGYFLITTTKTINQIGEGEGMYTEETEGPVPIGEPDLPGFPDKEDLIDPVFAEDEDFLVLRAALNDLFFEDPAFASEGSIGNVSFCAELSGRNLVSMSMEYTAASGNKVVISFVFDY